MTAISAHGVGCLPRPAPRQPPPAAGITGPDLPHAACKGQVPTLGPLWDDRVSGEIPDERTTRHQQATAICRTCPELNACHQARITDPTLGAGIWGGRLFGPGRACPCGEPIPTSAPAFHTYCGPRCREAANRPPKTTPRTGRCDHCRDTYVTHQPRQRFCSHDCRRQWQRRVAA
ncbi:MAG: hypothetical protein ACRDRC_05685 [Pseudonocardiaceae bacterium]